MFRGLEFGWPVGFYFCGGGGGGGGQGGKRDGAGRKTLSWLRPLQLPQDWREEIPEGKELVRPHRSTEAIQQIIDSEGFQALLRNRKLSR